MFRLLCPNRIVAVTYEIDAAYLKNQRLAGVIVDLDNTIIAWNSPTVPEATIQWVKKLQAANIQLCLLSNNRGPRVERIAKILAVPFVSKACKPRTPGFRQAVRAMNLLPREVAVVGDQIYTDILGGNRIGCHTIWVTPLSTQEFFGTKITRRLEKLTLLVLRRKGMIP
jgi:HAD superfamily phosphatase (TIGR01668 family)